MSSGVAVSSECLEAFQTLKLGKKLKYIIYGLNKDNTEIVVVKTSDSADYDEFVGDLPPADCRWAVYDFEYEQAGGGGKRNKLVFYMWSPDESKIKAKMLFASSKDALRRSLVGIATEIQGTDFSEIAYQTGASLRAHFLTRSAEEPHRMRRLRTHASCQERQRRNAMLPAVCSPGRARFI
ncbi:uncharacterized protein L969DRAFT_69603 [Mixia osmundae IAM 14324]|uniref:Cofilin n=1 Tax=Mixia osmundae (strain CBS 9802 / IAM 14324 / JCM 22182 / KY 12970) TaxID=764103 RepID=G7E337_MIXOS|nr:uncharacterized protein L969DRAFT_69603 [Mixia osmundae IAM 14324]KEI42493.1 hypothetical protein L969DRAFT_69603 [Mixia osmundae IAM 14324]GAA97218.1 hypothetical protein E5Q_03895 [Mixia osmundae IAM 14324]